MYFTSNGLPNEFLPEQLLASDLGEKIEGQGGSKWITIVRLQELFRPILYKRNIDICWSEKKQLDSFFECNDDFMAITEDDTYKTMLSKIAILNTVVKEMSSED